jgi:hypothetical protein
LGEHIVVDEVACPLWRMSFVYCEQNGLVLRC